MCVISNISLLLPYCQYLSYLISKFFSGIFIDFFVCFSVIKYFFYFVEVFSVFSKATVMFPLSALVKIILFLMNLLVIFIRSMI